MLLIDIILKENVLALFEVAEVKQHMIWLQCPYLNLTAPADKGASSAYDSEYEQRFLVTETRLRVLNLLLRL